MIAIGVVGSLPMQLHGYWSAKARKQFETAPTRDIP
jgi:hypothetical protein